MSQPPAPAHALVVVDVQRALVVGEHRVPGASRVLDAAAQQLAAARAAGCPVVHLQNDGAAGSPDAPGTAGWQLAHEVRPGEVVVRKVQDDVFAESDLAEVLIRQRVDCLSVCGFLSEMCVAATARSALRLGFGVTLARDAHATYPVPDQGPHAPGVADALVSRVAEWSLGDQVVLVDRSSAIRFTRP